MTIRLLIISLLLGVSTWLPQQVLAQRTAGTRTVEGVVQNQDGEPVAGVIINTTEGAVSTVTDRMGAFMIVVPENGVLYLKGNGMDDMEFPVTGFQNGGIISMVESPFHSAPSDEVSLPFGTLPRRRVVGAATTIKAEDILEFDTRQSVLGLINTRVPGVFGNTNVRGLGNALVVVDGIPRTILSDFNINVQEIEEITVLRDVTARMLYGSQADQGVILVTTKRGKAHERTTSITAETGMSQPLQLPNYLGAADYMELYNEALTNDGLAPIYTQEAIDATRAGTDPLRYPDQDLLSSTYINPSRPYSSLIAEFGGGNDLAQYYLNAGYRSTGTFLALGQGAEQQSDQLNLRANIDYQVNPFVKASLDVVAAFNFNQDPVGNFWNDVAGGNGALTLHPNAYPMIIDTNLVNNAELLAASTPLPGGFLPGGTSQLISNPYADLTQGGYVNSNNRLAQLNLGLEFDLGNIAEGLKLNTFLTGNINSDFTSSFINNYAVYQPSFIPNSAGADSLALTKVGEDEPADQENIGNTAFVRRLGYFANLSYDRSFGEDHDITAVAVAYADQLDANGANQSIKNLHVGYRANYAFKNKYILEAGGAYTGSPVLAQGNRFGFAPSFGVGWVLSEEGFLSGSSALPYLKLKASWGIINTDLGTTNYYLTQTNFAQTNNFNYADGSSQNQRMIIQNLANPGLGFAKRGEFSAGFEAMIGKLVFLEANYFQSDLYDMIIQPFNTTPAYLGDLVPYENYGRIRENGVEAGVNITKEMGDFGFSIGANFVYSVPTNIELDQPIPPEDYLDPIGLPSDALFGWVAMGLFADSTEILASPTQNFGPVRPGDIRYEDLNGDGVIDNNDRRYIGDGSPRFQYGLNLRVSYKGFELFAQGSGQTGQERYLNNPYFWVFGDRRYSDVVTGRWTPATASSATYPRLTSTNNPNNFRNSTYWMRSNNGFRLHAVQLTYYLPQGVMDRLRMDRVGIYLLGTNLVDISDITEVRTLNHNSAPQTRNYSAGIRAYFN